MKPSWQMLSQEVVHENPWFNVRHDKVLTPEGKQGNFYVVSKPPAVIIVATDEQKRIALIRLYRYPTQQFSLEVPAGGVENNEPPIEAAKRELQEEAGCVAKTWKELGVIQLANGALDQLAHVFHASDISLEHESKQIEEGIDQLNFVSEAEVRAMIKRGEITSSPILASLLLYFTHE